MAASTDLGRSFGAPTALAGLGAGVSPLCGLTPAGGHGVQLSSGRPRHGEPVTLTPTPTHTHTPYFVWITTNKMQ